MNNVIKLKLLVWSDGRVENLRASIERLGGDQTHTLRGLESYEKSIEQDSLNAAMNATQNQVSAH